MGHNDPSRPPPYTMNLPLLAIAAFGIGTTEFVILGLLPEVAQNLAVGIPAAGMLVSAYALGVAVGGPILAVATARLPRKTTLAWLMVLFTIGLTLANVLGVSLGTLMGQHLGWRSTFWAVAVIGVLAVLGVSVLASTSMFTLFTYINPILRDVTGVSPKISAVCCCVVWA